MRFSVVLFALAALMSLARDGLGVASLAEPIARERLQAQLLQVPLSFEANHGQVDPQVQFFARGRGYHLFLTPTEAVLALRADSTSPAPPYKGGVSTQGPPLCKGREGGVEGSCNPGETSEKGASQVVRMQLLGANPTAPVAGREKQEGIVNYFIGNDQTKWRTNIPTYGKVQYENVYPGIDLVYYGTNQRQMEYDFIIAPGADPKQIALSFEGAEQVELNRDGDLTLTLPKNSPSPSSVGSSLPPLCKGRKGGVEAPCQPNTRGEGAIATESPMLRLKKPIVYQVIDGVRHDLYGGYVLNSQETVPQVDPGVPRPSRASRPSRPATVAFAVAAYDPAYPLIIDPVFGFVTYFGGSGEDEAFAVDRDSSENLYLTGYTSSTSGIVIGTPYDSTQNGGMDVFITKLNAFGARVYSTYLGGSGNDVGYGIVVDGSGNAYVTGWTASSTGTVFPGLVTYQGGASDAFISKVNSSGTALLFSLTVGGVGADVGRAIALLQSRTVPVITGTTTSPTIPTSGSQLPGDNNDAFVLMLNTTNTGIEWVRKVAGATRADDAGTAIVADSTYIYVTGWVTGSSSPSPMGEGGGTPFQSTHGGLSDAFVLKLDTSNNLAFMTYLGGNGFDYGMGIALDAASNVYVAGGTSSPNFPLNNPYQRFYGGGGDAFLSKLNPSGSTLLLSTYLGGSGYDQAMGISYDSISTNRVALTGVTFSRDFPTTSDALLPRTLEPKPDGMYGDAFVAIILTNTTPTSLQYSTYLGGRFRDQGYGVRAAGGAAAVVGTTFSDDLPDLNSQQFALAGSSSQQAIGATADTFVGYVGTACGLFANTDVSVSQSVATNSPIQGDVTYTLQVGTTAQGTGVTLWDFLPRDVAFVSANTTACTHASGRVACNLGTLSAGSLFTVTIRAHLLNGASGLGNDALVTHLKCDSNPANNRVLKGPDQGGSSQMYTLTVTTELTGGTTMGTVTSLNVPGIKCGIGGNDCTEAYKSGTVVRLWITRSANADNLLAIQGDDDCQDKLVVMAGNRTCRFVFYVPSSSGALSVDYGADFGAVTNVGTSCVKPMLQNLPNASLVNNTRVTLSVTGPFRIIGDTQFDFAPGLTLGDDPSPNYVNMEFTPTQTGESTGTLSMHWEGCEFCPFDNPVEFGGVGVLNSDDSCSGGTSTSAQTAAAPSGQAVPELLVTLAGPVQGAVRTQGTQDINCGLAGYDCSHPSPSGSIVRLEALETPEAAFDSWSSNCGPDPNYPGQRQRCQVVMDGNSTTTTVTATFSKLQRVTITANDPTATEAGPTTGEFTVKREGSTASALDVAYGTSGTATNGIDYDFLPLTITIPAGQPSATLTVTPINDTLGENDETVVVQLLTTLSGYQLGSPSDSEATVTITSDDPPSVSIAATLHANEAGPTAGAFTVTRAGPTTDELTIPYTVSVSSTATAGSDYMALGTSVTIPAGQPSATIPVIPINDTEVEGTETVIVTLGSGAGYSLGSPSQATMQIFSDEKPVVTIVATDNTATEAGLTTGTFTVTRAPVTSDPLTVNYSRTGSASTGDFTLSPPASSVTISANQASAAITVTPIQDTEVEFDETVRLTLSSSTSYSIGSPSNATVTIADDDGPTVTVAADSSAALEAGPVPRSFTVSRTGATTSDLNVSYVLSGTATNGSDYQDPGNGVIIPSGQSSVLIPVTPIDDLVPEAPETVVLTLVTNFINPYNVGTTGTATATIESDDAVPTVTIDATTATVAEGNSLTFRISRTGPTDSSLTVSYNVGGTATPGSDYTALSGSTIINAGSAFRSILVSTVNDPDTETDETVVVTLATSQVNLYTIGASSVATMTITSNDPAPQVTLTPASATATEGGSAATLTVTRTFATSSPLTVAVTATPANGATAADYTLTPSGNVTILANQTTATFTVTAVDDAEVDPNEQVTVKLSPSSGIPYAVGSPDTTTVTLVSNDGSLSVSSSGNGTGSVTCAVSGLATPCGNPFLNGTMITLTATASTGSAFANWSGCTPVSGMPTQCTATISGATSVTATFNIQTFALTISKTGTGTGTVTCSGTGVATDCSGAIAFGTQVTVTAAAGIGSTFTGWGSACGGTGSCRVTMTGATAVTATFTLQTFALTVSKTGTGTGSVTCSGTGVPTDCSGLIPYGTAVTVLVTPNGGTMFLGWSGACRGTGSCHVTMTGNKTVKATFRTIPAKPTRPSRTAPSR